MQETQMGSDAYIMILAENILLEQIREIYEDVSTTSGIKREKRENVTERFVEMQENKLGRPKEKIRQIVDKVIERTRWIKEIEELDEELDEER